MNTFNSSLNKGVPNNIEIEMTFEDGFKILIDCILEVTCKSGQVSGPVFHALSFPDCENGKQTFKKYGLEKEPGGFGYVHICKG